MTKEERAEATIEGRRLAPAKIGMKMRRRTSLLGILPNSMMVVADALVY